MREPAKICIFTETYYPVVGGGETQARLLAEGLVGQNYQVVVLTRRTESTHKRNEIIGGVEIRRLLPVGRQHWKKWGLLFTGLLALIRFRKKYDLILVSGYRVIGLAAVLVSLVAGKVCILKADNNGEMSGSFFTGGLARYGVREDSFIPSLFVKLRNVVLRRAQAFIAISSDIREELIQFGKIPAHKIHTIPNSVDTTVFHPVEPTRKSEILKELGLPDKDLFVIYTGRLVSYKGLFTLIKAWENIIKEHANAGLLLVGGGSLDIFNCEDELKDYVQKRNLGESVFFTGEVTNVSAYLQAADIFVFPTEKEAFGISLIEAMACGLPVISTNVGGLKDILENGRNGLVIQAKNCEQLRAAMTHLLTDETARITIASAAEQTIEGCYISSSVIQKYTCLINSNQHCQI